MRLVNNAILFVGVPAGVLVSLDIGGQLDVPQWLLFVAYLTIGLILVAGIFVGIFSKVE